MSKTIITSPNGQQVIHSSDGKDAAVSASSGKAVVTTVSKTGQTTSVHGQIVGTSIVFDNDIK